MQAQIEITCFMIKPDGVQRWLVETNILILRQNGFQLVVLKLVQQSKITIREP